MQPDVVGQFASLFSGREDAVGLDEGGCERKDGISTADWHSHLNGGAPLGIYPVRADNTCRWGAVDYDVRSEHKGTNQSCDYETEAEAHAAAVSLQRALWIAYGLTGWVEITRSRGRHVWVFAETWVPAKTMRYALLVASEVAGTPTREINPKQTELPEGALGNYVRLPYPNSLRQDGPEYQQGPERYMVAGSFQRDGYHLSEFVEMALKTRATQPQLEHAAGFYAPPPPPIEVSEHATPVCDAHLTKQLSPLAWTIFSKGPLEGSDRSGTLFRLTHHCKEDGLPPEGALSIITAADEAWGKFSARADGAQRLKQMVSSVYRDWSAA